MVLPPSEQQQPRSPPVSFAAAPKSSPASAAFTTAGRGEIPVPCYQAASSAAACTARRSLCRSRLAPPAGCSVKWEARFIPTNLSPLFSQIMADSGYEFFYKNVIDTSSDEEFDNDLLTAAALLSHEHNVTQIPMYHGSIKGRAAALDRKIEAGHEQLFGDYFHHVAIWSNDRVIKKIGPRCPNGWPRLVQCATQMDTRMPAYPPPSVWPPNGRKSAKKLSYLGDWLEMTQSKQVTRE